MLDQSLYEKADEIIKIHGKKQESLIPVMKDIQKIYNTIAPELLSYVAKSLGVPVEAAYSSASNKFSVDLKGKYVIKVCNGIACHARAGEKLLEHLYKELNLSANKNTTDDLLFTVEQSDCLSACGQAPVMMVNDKLYPQMTPEKVSEVIGALRVEFNELLENGIENMPSDKAIDIKGNLNKTGLMDIPEGTTLREIIENYCGGFTEGKSFKAAQIGTAPGGYRIVKDLDYKLDFDALKKAKTMIRTRVLIIMDEDTCMVDTIHKRLKYSVENEICGKCVPCREGTMRMDEIMEDIVEGRACVEQLDILQELGNAVVDTGLCLLGITAVIPVLDALRDFNEEFVEHIEEKKCRAGKCKALLNYTIVPNLCRGCSKCARNCPVNAITGEIKNPFEIDKTKCIKCGACALGCPFKAITRE